MLFPSKTLEREALLKRLRELDQEYTENERELWEIKKRMAARLPVQEQFAFYLEQAIGAVSPGFSGRVRILP